MFYFESVATQFVHLESLCDFRATWIDNDDVARPVGGNRGGRVVRALVNAVVENHVAFATSERHLGHVHSPLPFRSHWG